VKDWVQNMQDEGRLSGMLELARQHTQRLAELEQEEWKINFSLWALLGGVAYLHVNGHVPAPRLVFLVVGGCLTAGMHAVALYRLCRQQEKHRIDRHYWRMEAAKLIGVQLPASANVQAQYWLGLRRSDLGWLLWEVIVTIAIAGAVALIIQNQPVPLSQPN
jgi:hypothetical protein